MAAKTPRTLVGLAGELLDFKVSEDVSFEKWLSGYTADGQWLGLPAIASAVYDAYGDKMQELVSEAMGLLNYEQYAVVEKMQCGNDMTYQPLYAYIKQVKPEISQVGKMRDTLADMGEAEDLKDVAGDFVEVLKELRDGKAPRPYHLTVLSETQKALSKPLELYPAKSNFKPLIDDKGLIERERRDLIMTKIGHLVGMCENALAGASRTPPQGTGKRFEL